MAIAYGKKLDEQDAKTLAEAGPWAQDEIRRHRMFGGGGLSAEAIKRLAVDRADETREEAIDRDRGRKGRNPAYVAGMFGPAEDRVYIYRPKRWK